MTTSPADNLKDILARIALARKAAVAPAPATELIAVSKMHDADAVREVLNAGHRQFGENRVQEAMGKFPALKEDYADLVLHLIGPLQSNKTKEAVALFEFIHTLDRPKLAHAIADEAKKAGRCPVLFIQVNTGEEDQKAGVSPKDAPALIALTRELKLPVLGLMCIPPVNDEPSPHFALLQKMAREHGMLFLSMGMSEDFETAIQFGATHVRVGSAVFGKRA